MCSCTFKVKGKNPKIIAKKLLDAQISTLRWPFKKLTMQIFYELVDSIDEGGSSSLNFLNPQLVMPNAYKHLLPNVQVMSNTWVMTTKFFLFLSA